LALQAPDSVVASIADATAVDTCFVSGINGDVSLSLGGKLDPVHAQPLPVNGRVLNLVEADPVGGKIAVLQVDQVKVIITERRKPFHYIAEFEKLGIDPLAHKIVVVKIGYLVPDLRRAAPLALLALSPGAVDQFIERLPYKRIHRPMYPLDLDMTWEP
jgi:microcystin degradation protein MlrC